MSLKKITKIRAEYKAAIDQAALKHLGAIDKARRKRDRALAKLQTEKVAKRDDSRLHPKPRRP